MASFMVLQLSACAVRPYQPVTVEGSAFLQRAITQEQGGLHVTAAVPDANETSALTGLDLYSGGIQPVWLKVENSRAHQARVALVSIDRDYFSPIEVAYMHRGKYSSQGYRDMERWFNENSLPRTVPPGESRSGLVFTNLTRGTKGFNLDVFSAREHYSFTFFVPMPGFTPDYMEVDFERIYGDQSVKKLTVSELQTAVEQDLPCCVTDSTGNLKGGPINTILVGTGKALRRALLRGKWSETRSEETTARGMHSQRFRGRPADGTFTLDRSDGNEQLILQLWLAPWQVDSEPVWVGQVYYTTRDKNWLTDLAGETFDADSSFLYRFANESISADVDSAMYFLLQNFWYNQSLLQWGLVAGMEAATVEQPRVTFHGESFFTQGYRTILFLSETPVGIDESKIIYAEQLTVPQELTADE